MPCTFSDETRAPGATCPKPSTTGARDCFCLLGTVVEGRYLVERVVGSGGYGVVYRARHLRLDSPVALKVLRVEDSLESGRRAAIVERFTAESRLTFGLGGLHPAIARVLECGVVHVPCESTGPLPYLAMEWLDGVSLAEQLQLWRRQGQAPLSARAALELLTPIAEALMAAHDRGIAHRDVKPANIMLAQRGNQRAAVLLDFGLAKAGALAASTTERFNQSDDAPSAFTPSYAAPEQWLRRLGSTGPWTDVHALALICVELMTGRHPFEAEDTQQLLAACIDAAQRPLPRRVGVPCPQAVELVLERALAVAPRERYRDARSFWAALRAAAAAPSRQHRAANRKWRRRSAWLLLAATLALAGQLRGERSTTREVAAAASPAPLRESLGVVQAATTPSVEEAPGLPLVTASSAPRSPRRAPRLSSAMPAHEPEAVAIPEPSADEASLAPGPAPPPSKPINLLESNAFSLRN